MAPPTGRPWWQLTSRAPRLATKAHVASMSALTGTKGTLEAQVDLVLTKLPVLREAQYPDEQALAAKRREMGYLKKFD